MKNSISYKIINTCYSKNMNFVKNSFISRKVAHPMSILRDISQRKQCNQIILEYHVVLKSI